MSPDPIEHAVAVGRLRAWVHGEAAERPTRAELRAWADHLLADRDELFAAHEKANRERAALRREQEHNRDSVRIYAQQVEGLQTANRRLRAERDALQLEQDSLERDVAGVTAVIGERDAYRDEAQALAAQVTELIEELEKARERGRNCLGTCVYSYRLKGVITYAQRVEELIEELEKARDQALARGGEAAAALAAGLRDGGDPGDGPGISVTTTTTRMFIPHDAGGAG